MALARRIMEVIEDKLGSDILLLDLTGVTLIADYFVIATADSERQLNAIAEDVVTTVKREGQRVPLSVEGTTASGWVLIDLGGVVVHLFSEAMRDRYQLESLWNDARVVVRLA